MIAALAATAGALVAARDPVVPLSSAVFPAAADPVTLVGLTILGAMLGSFCNVLIHRLPPRDDQRAHGARSACPACGAPIPAWLNVPILAWLWLRGRARCCGARISGRYPLVEALTAALVFLLVRFPPLGVAPSFVEPTFAGWASFVLGAFLICNLVANTFIDIEFHWLLDRLTRPLLLVGFVAGGVFPELPGRIDAFARLPDLTHGLLASALGALVGGGVVWLVRVVGGWVFRREAMGLGDVKLMLGVGAFLGWQGALLTFFVGALLGALLGSLRRLFVRGDELPFGPYLAAGAVGALFMRDGLVRFLTVDWPEWLLQHQSAAQAVAVVLVFVAAIYLLRSRRRRAGGSESPPSDS
ncbi:MAG: prepilin peptidase [Planctomycetes bacterium]|nr:prepilin peptidase [Planctomycetota bacterium]